MGGGGRTSPYTGAAAPEKGPQDPWVQIYPAIGRVDLTASGQLL